MRVREEGNFAITDNSEVVRVSQGHLNGLMIVAESVADCKISIEYRGKENVMLRNNMTLELASKLSDLEGGSSVTATNISPIWVDLGSVYLEDSEIVLTIQGTNDERTSTGIRVSSISVNPEPFSLKVYDCVKDTQVAFKGVNQVLGYLTATGDYATEKDSTVLVTTEDENYNVSIETANALGAYFSEMETDAGTQIMLIFNDEDTIPQDIDLKASMVDSSKIEFIGIKEHTISTEVSKNTVKQLRRITEKTKRLESKKPLVAKALRHSGMLFKSADLEHTLRRTAIRKR